MVTHLTDADVATYQARQLGGADRDRIAEHLADCGECTARLLGATALAGAADRMELALRDTEAHLPYETLEAWANNTLLESDRESTAAHLVTCDRCRADADNLRRFGEELRMEIAHAAIAIPKVVQQPVATAPRGSLLTYLRLPVVAALSAAAIVWGAFVLPARQEAKYYSDKLKSPSYVATIPRTSPSPIPDVAAILVVRARQRVEEAERKQRAAQSLMAKRAKEAQLAVARAKQRERERDVAQAQVVRLRQRLLALQTMPSPLQIRIDPRNAVAVVATRDEKIPVYPVRSTVTTTRPTLRWSVVPDATSYVITVVDNRGNPVAQTDTDATAWQVVSDLAPGAAYTWNITPKGSTAKSQSARFTVASRADLLAVARVYLALGATDDARDALTAVGATSGDHLAGEAESLLRMLSEKEEKEERESGKNR